MSYTDEANVTRREYESFKSDVSTRFEYVKEAIGTLTERITSTRIVLHGEDGTNGIKSSVERAHKAIVDIQTHLKVLNDGIAAITLQSETGDRQMEIMVLTKLQELTEKMDEKEKKAEQAHREIEEERAAERRWRIGQIIALVGIFVAVLIGV